ncbi:MAG: PSD1 domain-containing protein [Planctomycetales bacterium]|nr:PSD1 domain-containing protein [Planctomycetales bacterium]
MRLSRGLVEPAGPRASDCLSISSAAPTCPHTTTSSTRHEADRGSVFRSMSRLSLLGFCLLASWSLVNLTAVAAQEIATEEPSVIASQDEVVDEVLLFERDIRPILRAHCLDCHGATAEHEGGLDLRQVRLMLAGGDSGPAIDLAHVSESLLLERVRLGEMPPGKSKMTDAELEVLERWLAAGAPTARPESDMIDEGIGILPEDRAWWSFQPLERPAPPSVDDPRLRNDLDRFVLARLQDKGLEFSPPASQRELAIRVWIDLTGLPPTAAELDSYLADTNADAYERLIDRLMNTDAYGERWGRHWLDVSGYADSEGYTTADAVRPWSYFYRDYVIRAFRDDKPIDQFVTEQLAGDELYQGDLANPDPATLDPLIATGFLRMAVDGTGQGGVDEPVARNQTVSDTLKIVSSGLMGVTLACAQCHDHRYDPILQEDYYRLRAVFDPALDWQAWKPPAARRVSLYTQADRDLAAQIEQEAQAIAAEKNAKQAEFMAAALNQELEKYDEPLKTELRTAYETPGNARTEEQKALLAANPSVNISPGVLYQYNQAAADELKTYDQRIAEVRARKPEERFLRVLQEPPGHQPETHVFHRGDYRQPTKVVMPGDLTVLANDGERIDFALDDPELPTSGRRLALARQLTSGRHPLFNRVFVNRIWMHHFGRGIVGTPAEFGRLGDLPTHPELLDYLACELADGGWSLKHLHRIILTSHTYRQSSRINEAAAAIDADTQYYWRYPLKRLEAEAIRDRVLQCAGSLDPTTFGPAVALQEDDAGQVMPTTEARRSIYLQVRRTQPVSFLQAFDAPIMETNCERRTVSTVAPQALMLLNSDFIRSQATLMTERLTQAADNEVSDEEVAQFADLTWPSGAARWSFGWGPATTIDEYDPTGFSALPHWTGNAWQGGETLPDPGLEWCTLSAGGGHPGTGRALVRRFHVNEAGSFRVTGKLTHGSPNGDGVQAYAVVARGEGQPAEIVGRWSAAHGESSTESVAFLAEPGQTIDLVILGGESVNSDSFGWQATVHADAADGSARAFDSVQGFHGPVASVGRIDKIVVLAWRRALLREPTQDEMASVAEWMRDVVASDSQAADPAAAIEQALISLCQTLMGSNEFLYVE